MTVLVVDSRGDGVGWPVGFTRPGVLMVQSNMTFQLDMERGFALPNLHEGFSDTQCATPVGFFGDVMPIPGELFEATELGDGGSVVTQAYLREPTASLSQTSTINSYLDSAGNCVINSGPVTSLSSQYAYARTLTWTAYPPFHLVAQ